MFGTIERRLHIQSFIRIGPPISEKSVPDIQTLTHTQTFFIARKTELCLSWTRDLWHFETLENQKSLFHSQSQNLTKFLSDENRWSRTYAGSFMVSSSQTQFFPFQAHWQTFVPQLAQSASDLHSLKRSMWRWFWLGLLGSKSSQFRSPWSPKKQLKSMLFQTEMTSLTFFQCSNAGSIDLVNQNESEKQNDENLHPAYSKALFKVNTCNSLHKDKGSLFSHYTCSQDLIHEVPLVCFMKNLTIPFGRLSARKKFGKMFEMFFRQIDFSPRFFIILRKWLSFYQGNKSHFHAALRHTNGDRLKCPFDVCM